MTDITADSIKTNLKAYRRAEGGEDDPLGIDHDPTERTATIPQLSRHLQDGDVFTIRTGARDVRARIHRIGGQWRITRALRAYDGSYCNSFTLGYDAPSKASAIRGATKALRTLEPVTYSLNANPTPPKGPDTMRTRHLTITADEMARAAATPAAPAACNRLGELAHDMKRRLLRSDKPVLYATCPHPRTGEDHRYSFRLMRAAGITDVLTRQRNADGSWHSVPNTQQGA